MGEKFTMDHTVLCRTVFVPKDPTFTRGESDPYYRNILNWSDLRVNWNMLYI